MREQPKNPGFNKMYNTQNLTPFRSNDGRQTERQKGGHISAYRRIESRLKSQALQCLLLSMDIKKYYASVKNKPIGKKRLSQAKQYAHKYKIELNRFNKLKDKAERRKEELSQLYGTDI